MTLNELEEEAHKRKERLAQWKVTKQRQTTKRKEYEDDENNIDKADTYFQEETIEFPKPMFRNYKPNDSAHLSGAIVLPKPKLIDVKSMVIKLKTTISFSLKIFVFRLKIKLKINRLTMIMLRTM